MHQRSCSKREERARNQSGTPGAGHTVAASREHAGAPGANCAIAASCRRPRKHPDTPGANRHPASRHRRRRQTPRHARSQRASPTLPGKQPRARPGTCIPEPRARLSRQSSLERKASATDKCPASLRTASHFLCPGNGTLFYGEKRYVRYGAAFVFGKVPSRTPNEGS